VVVKDMEQARLLCEFITGSRDTEEFYTLFSGQYSGGFDVKQHLKRVGVVNQTTMLASETQAIADHIRQAIAGHYQLTEDNIGEHFADTRDTLCYATNDNQSAVTGMLREKADLAMVVGGYNSSNTSHLVELCEAKFPTYFIASEEKIVDKHNILHWDIHARREILSHSFLPEKVPVTILLTSGASCPDALVEGVIRKLLSLYGMDEKLNSMIAAFA
jgi:4-hydroxy-3-methylbut-2-enyl diphosphate reductase